MRSDCDACGQDHIQECDCGHTTHYRTLRRVVNAHEGLVSRLDCAAEAFAFIAEGIESGDANHAELFDAARKNESLARATLAKVRG